MKRRYSLLYVEEQGWPVPHKTFVEMTLKKLRQTLNIEDAKKVQFVKNQYVSDIDDDTFKLALRVVDNVTENGDISVLLNVPHYGNIKLPSNECKVVKLYLGEELPSYQDADIAIAEDEYVAKEFSTDKENSIFKIVRPFDESNYDMFDEILALEYSVLYDNDTEEQVKTSKDSPFDIVSLYQLKNKAKYEFDSLELATYTDRITGVLVELFKSYYELDEETISIILDDFKNALHVVDISDVFKSIRDKT